jgi:hypothetical protein
MLGLEIFEDGVPPRFRIRFEGRLSVSVAIQKNPITTATTPPTVTGMLTMRRFRRM